MRFRPKHLKLDESGLHKILGFLEAEILEAVWSGGEMSVRGVRDALTRRRPYSFNTVMTVMNRLVEKKLLEKRSRDGSFVYRAAVDKEAFLRDVTRSVVSALVKDGALFQLAAFVEVIKERSDDDLKALRRIIDEEA